MRQSMLGLALALSCLAPATAQTWMEYVDHDERFLVNFPGEPDVEEISYATELGASMPTHIYSVDLSPSHYSMTVVDYTQAPRVHEERCRRLAYECDGFEVGTEIRGAIAFAAWNYRRSTEGKITYDAYAQVDGIPGHQLQITNPDGSRTFVAIHLHARRLYILEATVPEQAPPPGLFQQSLVIFDENGQRVRYIYGNDDRPIRVEASFE